MAETAKKGKPKKGKGKVQPWMYVAGGGVVAVGYYLYKQHSANTAAANSSGTTGTDAIDPNTGLPYSQETGANAVDPLTGQTYASELASGTGANAVDPNTGLPYSSETGLNAINPATGDTWATDYANLQSELASAAIISGGGGSTGGDPNAGGGGGNGSPQAGNQNAVLNAWKAAILAKLAKQGVTGTGAQNVVDAYLKGIPQVDARAAAQLAKVLSTSPPAPVTNGSSLKVTVSRTVSQALAKVVAVKTRSTPVAVKSPAKVVTAKKKGSSRPPVKPAAAQGTIRR